MYPLTALHQLNTSIKYVPQCSDTSCSIHTYLRYVVCIKQDSELLSITGIHSVLLVCSSNCLRYGNDCLASLNEK